MQKISRIYVGNYGTPGAWYDGQVFDLCGPHATDATDTIINLENGGGKTTLLSFVLSCFEPSQNKWLSHLVSMHKRCHFHEYFAEDGRPATCAIEWEMPSRIAGGQPYNLVLVQVVSRHTQDAKPDVARLFFSFEYTRGLALGAGVSFDTLPAPKLCTDPALTLQAYRKWIHDHRADMVDFFLTESHDGWLTHLRERNVDVDMLRMQVSFSATEGGIDQGFLRFKTEEDLLRTIFRLAVDETRSAAVRNVVVEACERLRRKPILDQRAEALAGLHGVLQAFSTSAVDYVKEKQALESIMAEAQSLAAGLIAWAELATKAAEAADEETQGYEGLRRTASADAAHATAVGHALERRQHVLVLDNAILAYDAARTAHQSAKTELRLVAAGQLESRIHAHKAQIDSLEKQVEDKTRELEPVRREAMIRGSRLRYKLVAEERAQRTLATQCSAHQSEHQREVERLDGAMRALQAESTQLATFKGQLLAAQTSCDRQRETLLADGVLESNEGALAAAERHRQRAAQARDSETALHDEARSLRERATNARSAAAAQREDAAGKEKEAELLEDFVAKGLAEKEALQQNPILQACTESGNADIESAIVGNLLDKMIASQERELMGATVLISQLGADQDAITKTGLAGLNPNVDKVVAALEAIGVKSASAYNKYIAEVAPDAERARQIVRSNPARFLGVHVSSGEFDLARGLLAAPPELTKPVVISIAQVEPDAAMAGCIAVMPDEDSAFNYEAAARRAQTIADRRHTEEEKEKALKDRLTQARAVRSRITHYISVYGNGRLAMADEDAQRLSAAAKRLRAEATEMDNDAANQEQTARAKDGEAREAASRASASANSERRAQEFWRLHEKEEPQRARDLAGIQTKEEGLARRRDALVTDHNTAIAQRDNARNDAQRHEQLSNNYVSDYTTITLFDAGFDAAADLDCNPQGLEALQKAYQSQKNVYDADEKSRLDVIGVQLNHERMEHTRLTREYQRDFHDLGLDQVQAKRELNFEVAIPAARTALEDSAEKEGTASTNKGIAHERLQEHERQHPESIRAVLDDADAPLTDIGQITARIRACFEQARCYKEDMETAANSARQSQAAAEAARARATTASDAFKTLVSPFEIEGPIEAAALAFTDGENPTGRVAEILKRHSSLTKSGQQKYKKASDLFQRVRDYAKAPKFLEVEPEMSALLCGNDFDASCAMHEQLVKAVIDREDAVQYSLTTMRKDFEACVGELNSLCTDAISILNAITTTKKLPPDAPYVGGKPVLKMDARFASKSAQTRKDAIDRYLTGLISSNKIPEHGYELVAAALIAIHGTPLNVQVLRMVPNISQQYLAVDKIVNSGGEGVVMAIFLYIVIMMLRAEVQAKVKRAGGGPLILDNPFAKATSPKLWDACRKLAQAADLQLIFATALQDYNTLANFNHFVRLRRAGTNTKTGRIHLEVVDHTLKASA